eukprot:86610-Rhodomonas_salina.4
MSGTEAGYGATSVETLGDKEATASARYHTHICLRAPCAVSGTDTVYGVSAYAFPTICPVLRFAVLLPGTQRRSLGCYRPIRLASLPYRLRSTPLFAYEPPTRCPVLT